jgi:hypothetical protein
VVGRFSSPSTRNLGQQAMPDGLGGKEDQVTSCPRWVLRAQSRYRVNTCSLGRRAAPAYKLATVWLIRAHQAQSLPSTCLAGLNGAPHEGG